MSIKYCLDYKEPFLCTAIHNGYRVSDLVQSKLNISKDERLREEDPLTEYFTGISSNRIIAQQSRFEYDLNRSRDKAVYQVPEDAWGLKVRSSEFTPTELKVILTGYDLFYKRVEQVLQELVDTFGFCFVWDIHSYNHHRLGADELFDDPQLNPEIIIGTSNLSSEWDPLVTLIFNKIKSTPFMGRAIDVRKNVKFTGGYFPRWVNKKFEKKVCCLSIEFKKIFMDEWTGLFYPDVMRELRGILLETKQVVMDYHKSFAG